MRRKKKAHEFAIDIDPTREKVASGELLSDRVLRSRQDRVWISRFVALLLFGLGIANFVPVIMTDFFENDLVLQKIPRWMYLLPFLGLLHLVYSIFLFQIPDWSALRSASVFQLICAALFGFVSVALLLGAGNGEVATFLELPFDLLQRAMIWCLVMLLVELAGSYVSGTEAASWKKMERLFQKLNSGTVAAVEAGKN